jgi:hypothetical protein
VAASGGSGRADREDGDEDGEAVEEHGSGEDGDTAADDGVAGGAADEGGGDGGADRGERLEGAGAEDGAEEDDGVEVAGEPEGADGDEGEDGDGAGADENPNRFRAGGEGGEGGGDGVAGGDVPGLVDLDLGHDAGGEAGGGGEAGELFEGVDDDLPIRQRGLALGALADVRLERGNAEPDLAVEQLVDFVRE